MERYTRIRTFRKHKAARPRAVLIDEVDRLRALYAADYPAITSDLDVLRGGLVARDSGGAVVPIKRGRPRRVVGG